MMPDEKAPIEPEDDPEPVAEDVEEPTETPLPTPKKSQARAPRTKRPAVPAPEERSEEKEGAGEEEEKDGEEDEGPKAPRRPTLDPETARLLAVRHAADQHRPLFVREQSHRYYAVGRTGKWRTPRGLQSKQRRHYGYRPVVVRIGYRSPARVRGLTPTGFRPVIIHTREDLARLNVQTEAAILARTIGTRKRLVLEETARKLGIKVLNPLVKEHKEA
jgi:large subunit ribosomal protein L32e